MGLEFLFIHALWALPLAGLPIVLHLLFRRRSPVVLFSTLRFVKTSLQHTAARRKVQRWLLLATRALLLLLLIAAMAQPARRLATSWLAGPSTAAAIVVDTSYSMLLQEQQVALLDRASATVEELLRTQLHDADVALFRSQPDAERERLQPASALLSQWTALTPEPAPEPLLGRIHAAARMLAGQDAGQKWLVVLSDLHTREFPQPAGAMEDLRVALIDLRPVDSRSAGITRLSIAPPQPIPGITSELTVEVAGRSGDARPVAVSIQSADGQVLHQHPPQVVRFDGTGRAQLRLPLELPAQRWLRIVATLQAEDATPLDNRRVLLVEVPPRQAVTVLDTAGATGAAAAARFAQLALDPGEGTQTAWPLQVARRAELAGGEDVVVALLTRWPDRGQATRLRDVARGGGTVLLFLQPGLEGAWKQVDAATQAVLRELLPGEPTNESVGSDVAVTVSDDAAMGSVAAASESVADLRVWRMVPMNVADPAVTALLRAVPAGANAAPLPLLARRDVAAGRVFTWSTLPDTRFTNLPLHPLFLQLMVTTALPSLDGGGAANVEIGRPLHLSARYGGGAEELDIEAPGGQVTRVRRAERGGGNETARQGDGEPAGLARSHSPAVPVYSFTATDAPGEYAWRQRGGLEPVARANVQLPAAEADVRYREPEQAIPPADNVVVARSLEDLRTRLGEISEPAPRWTWAVALVLILLCLEALMGSVSRLWQPGGWRKAAPVPTS